MCKINVILLTPTGGGAPQLAAARRDLPATFTIFQQPRRATAQALLVGIAVAR
jgi:hypothetical protein